MANYLSDRTGASIDTVLDNADAGNIGKTSMTPFIGDIDTILTNGFKRVFNTATNIPTNSSGTLITSVLLSTDVVQQYTSLSEKTFIRVQEAGVWKAWNELYHTGNTGVLQISDDSSISLAPFVSISKFTGRINIGNDSTSTTTCIGFYNSNARVGGVETSGTATSYNTSSDPRLKDFTSAPSDIDINAEFNAVFSCFRTFNWKNDPQGDLVWGFDAHACIDAGTGTGSEGEGPRDLPLGSVYETTPAVTESRVVMDADGNPTTEIEEVIVTPAIEKRVSPAGVDQSKVVPILLAKIEQLERRLTAAGL